MALKALQVDRVRHSGGRRPDKLQDGDGLFLLIYPSNAKSWRLRYTFDGRRHEISLGKYPAVNLALARKKAAEIRIMIAEGTDPKPSQEKEERQFFVIAVAWWDKQAPKWSSDYAKKVKRWIERDMLLIGKLSIDKIDHGHIRDVMLKIEADGRARQAEPILSVIRHVFGYALGNRLTNSNPAQGFPLSDILKPLPNVQHRAAITNPKDLAQLLRDIEEKDSGGEYCTVQALRIAPFLFLRPGEVRSLRWEYIDFNDKLIRIPPEEMKKGRVHLVPMARQVIERMQKIQRNTAYSIYVFPNKRDANAMMSKNVLTNRLRTLGYGADVICAHGFRTTASTLLREQGWGYEEVEIQLAHLTGTATSRAYNQAQHIEKRRKMMQAWADYLDSLRQGGVGDVN